MGNCLPSQHRGVAPVPVGKQGKTKTVKRIVTQSTKASQNAFGLFRTQGQQIASPKPDVQKSVHFEYEGYLQKPEEGEKSQILSLERPQSSFSSIAGRSKIREPGHQQESSESYDGRQPVDSFLSVSRNAPQSGQQIEEDQSSNAQSQKKLGLNNPSNLVLKPTPRNQPEKVPIVIQKQQPQSQFPLRPNILRCWEEEVEHSPKLVLLTTRSKKITETERSFRPISTPITPSVEALREQLQRLNMQLQDLSLSQVTSTDQTQLQNSSYYGHKEAVTISTNDLIKLLQRGASGLELSFKIVE